MGCVLKSLNEKNKMAQFHVNIATQETNLLQTNSELSPTYTAYSLFLKHSTLVI